MEVKLIMIRVVDDNGDIILLPLERVSAVYRTEKEDRTDMVEVYEEIYEVAPLTGSSSWEDAVEVHTIHAREKEFRQYDAE